MRRTDREKTNCLAEVTITLYGNYFDTAFLGNWLIRTPTTITPVENQTYGIGVPSLRRSCALGTIINPCYKRTGSAYPKS